MADTVDSVRPVRRGDLRFASASSAISAERSLVLVWRTVEVPGCAEVLLAHPYTELATDHDVVVPASESATPYDVVVQTDLRSVVWETQLGMSVGRLGRRVRAAVSAAGRMHPLSSCALDPILDEARVWIGTRLTGPLDGRWYFKRDEGKCLRRLADDCTLSLLVRMGTHD